MSHLASFGLPRHESPNSKIFLFSFVLSLVLLIANKLTETKLRNGISFKIEPEQ